MTMTGSLMVRACDRHRDAMFWYDCCEIADQRRSRVNEIAIESSARMGGRDFDPRLEVVGSRRPPTVPEAMQRLGVSLREMIERLGLLACSVCEEPVQYPSMLDASGRCDECRP